MNAAADLVSLMQQRLCDRPNKPAYLFLTGDDLAVSGLTCAELDAQAKALAARLQEMKAQGARALLLYPPGLDFIVAFLGCLYAGVIAIPAYPPRLNRNALRILAIAQDSEANLALTTNSVFSRREALLAHSPTFAGLRWCATDDLSWENAPHWEPFRPNRDSLAYLQYTSGSTADPKGVMISHANVLENCGYIAKTFRHSGQDVSVSWLPHFHDLGLVHGILQPLYCGFPGYLMAPMTFLQRPLNWLKAITQFRATHSDGPNFAYDLCVNKIDDEEKTGLDLSTWRMALNGAEPVFPETIERFTAAFGPCGFKQAAFYPAYGLAEATLVVSGGKQEQELTCCSVSSAALEQNRIIFAETGNPGSRTLVASGSFSAPVEVEIVEPESGERCASDKIGEIWIAGPSIASGYWKRPEDTQQVFRAKMAGDTERTFLRTGDLGFIHCGNLFITGRLKELIIIRGRNYYPQDIERTAREACAEVRLGTGAAFSISSGTEERLVLVQEVSRRQAIEPEEIFTRIREAIAEEHEIQVHQIALVNSGTVPRTSSGKIQRGLSRKQFLEGSLELIAQWKADVAAAEQRRGLREGESLEQWLQSQVASRIGVAPDRIDVHRPLSRLGLDSLQAVELAHQIQRVLHLVWGPATLLEDVTIAELAARAAGELEKQQRVPAPEKEAKSEYPLSYGQQGLWFLQQLSPESTAYNVAQAIRICSSVDVAALKEAFQELIERHASLRTTFATAGGKPMQHIHHRLQLPFHFENAEGWSEKQLQERLTREAETRFNLERDPLFRVQLFRRSATEHILLLLAHHIIIDLWSLAQIMAEFAALYRPRTTTTGIAAPLPALESDYFDFVRWQAEMLSSEKGLAHWSYWSHQLAGDLPALDLPSDRSRPAVQTYRGVSCPFRLSMEATSKLRNVSRECGTTLYMAVLAAFQVLLHRCTGENEIVIGSPASGRTRAEFASTVGYFVNPVVLRSTISPGLLFRTFLSHHVRKTVLEALAHQDYPFSLLTERLQVVRDPARSPLFQVMFAMQKAHVSHEEGLSLFALSEAGARANLGGLEMESLPLEQRIAQFDLTLITAENAGELTATFEYNTDLFHAATIQRMIQQFKTLIGSIAADSNQQISSLRWLTEEQTAELIRTGQTAPSSIIPAPVHELFEQQAARTPDAMAIFFEGRRLSYREMNERAGRLAAHLRDFGVRLGTPVGVCLERSSEMILSLLAVLKAGAIYLPLDPDYPPQRLDFLLHDARAEILITSKRLLNSALQTKSKILYLNDYKEAVSVKATNQASGHANLVDAAYIIYTSGSAGQPKGVLVSHGAFSNHMQWLAREFPLQESDRVLHSHSPSFDAALSEIFHPLITGAALVIARAEGQLDIGYLIELMCAQRVTSIDTVPTLLRVLVEDRRITSCKDLRRVFSGGEVLDLDLKERIFERLGPIELINAYGPTETAITATFHRCSAGKNESRMSIGIPLANTQVYILDSSLQPVPVGVAGEIHIGGSGVALGYLNQPQLTAEKFIPNPFDAAPGMRMYNTGDLGRFRADGQIEYLGRTDHQVKIRGFRVELGEIEAALKRHGSVLDAVVVLKARFGKTKYAAAYVQPVKGETISPQQLRAHLRKDLPEYMLPAAIIPVERFSLLPSGKIDKKLLPEPEDFLLEAGLAPPRDRIERDLVKIWQEVLGRRDIGIYSNFFELGGDSILSLQVVSRAADAGLRLASKQIFQFQTIAALAQMAGKSVSAPESDNIPPGPVALTPIQRWFFQQDLQQPNHYVQSVALELHRPLDPKLLERAFRDVITRHDAFSLRFEHAPDEWRLRQKSAPGEDAAVFHYVSLASVRSGDLAAEMEKTSAIMRTSLNLESGPIICAAYFDLGHNPHRLLITAHHLVIDAVSWRIVVEELESACGQLVRCEEIALGRRTLSFQRWSQSLQDYTQSESVRRELDWWTLNLSGPTGRLPADRDGENTSASAEIIRVALPPDETHRLLHELPRVSRAEIKDALLAALAQALSKWTGEYGLLIDVEGHGREEIIEGADVSRTVGWFTTLYPVRLEVPATSAPDALLKSVRKQLRAIPKNGIGYGLLRYLAPPAVSDRLRDLPGAQVSFNYLGQLDQMLPATGIFALAEIMGPLQSALRRRSHVLEIDVYIKDSSLQFQWTYSHELHDRKTIERLASSFLDKLRAIAGHFRSPTAGEYTPADFPLIEITQSQLNRIVSIHGRVDDIYPLSPMQQGMLFHSLYEPDKATYLTHLVCELRGDLDKEVFGAAWQHVVNHYSALRATFESEILSEEPVQVIRRSPNLKWESADWSGIDPDRWQELLSAWLLHDSKREMDLQSGPLMRFFLARSSASQHIFVWSSHHLLLDGWSLPIVLKDVFAAYENLRKKEALPTTLEHPYRDYIDWLRKQDLSAAERFWRSLLKGFTAPTRLQCLEPEHVTDSNADGFCEQELQLTEAETERLREFAREYRLTLSTVTQGAWGLLLSRITQSSDVVFGVVVSGRHMRGAEAMVGVFINTLPARAKFGPADTLENYLKSFQEQQSEAALFEYTPLASIQSWSELPRGKQLFESILVIENYPAAFWREHPQQIQIENLRSFEKSNYPLTLWIMPGQRLSVKAGWDSRLLDRSRMHDLLHGYRSLLAEIGRTPAQKISELLQAMPCRLGSAQTSANGCSQSLNEDEDESMREEAQTA